MTAHPGLAVLVLLLIARPDAQNVRVTEATFVAATVKLHDGSSATDTGVRVQPGQFRATNLTLRELMELAYGIPHPVGRVRILGGPAWLDDLRFDVVAKGRDGSAPAELLIALRSLLAERFQLLTHRDTRDLPVYALVVTEAATRTRSRPGLAPSTIDCSAAPRPDLRSEPPDPGNPPPCVLMRTPGRLVGSGITMAALISNGLSRIADDRVIVDRTQLAGLFDVHVEWTPDQKEMRQSPLAATPPFVPVGPPDGPSFFTALQEQAGLKLQPSTGPVDVIVIDRADRPPAEP